MTPETRITAPGPLSQALPSPPDAPSPATPAPPRRRRWLLLLGGLLLIGGALAGWWWFHRPAPLAPPLPADIQDAQVLRAISRSRQALLQKPNAAGWGDYGMVLLAHLFDQEADRCFAEASRLDPTDARWPYCRGLIALKRRPEQAVSFLRQAAGGVGSPEDLAFMRLQLAEALLEREELDEAEKLFRAEQDRKQSQARAALGLGLIALARSEQQQAEAFLKTARSSKFARKKATAQLAVLARARGDSKAAAGYEKETRTLPDDPAWPDPLLDYLMHLRVGRRRHEREVGQLEQQHRFHEAAQMYLWELQHCPSARAYAGAAVNLARVGEYDKAEDLLRQGIRLDPENFEPHYALALTQFTRAEKQLQQTPGSPRIEEWFREAALQAKLAAQHKPDHAMAYLFWGLALKHLGEPAAAVAPLRQGVACRPEMLELQLGLGEALLESGQVQEAKSHLENARRLDPQDPRPAQALERLPKKK